MRAIPAAAVVLLLPAGCVSLGQLSIGGQQSVRDTEDFSELYKDFDADVQALLRGGTGGAGDPLLEGPSTYVLEEPGRMQQDGPAQTEPGSQPQGLAADDLASEDAQLAADLAEPVVAGAGAALAETSPQAPGDSALPPEQGAGAEAPERAAGGAEISAEPLGEPSADEAPPAVALEALPLVPGIPEAAPAVALQALPMVPGGPRPPSASAVALEALPMVPGAPRAPAQERRTVSPVDLHNQELTTETMEEAPPNLDDILARTEKIATILAQDSGTLAVELSELTRKLKASRAGAQRTLAAEATPPSIPASDLEQGPTPDRPGGADAGKDKEKEKSGGGWLEKSTISSPILTLNHQLADYPTYMFWSGVGLLSIIVCCSCCVRPMMRRRQEARDGRLL
ncbi:unnamed protein product [Prorocentrum cordatum]|uniref:Uncharacterized protein n=1 Tax=Prorocentrum cordatum TaxID=2364126 RepID=A0ABN9U3Z3_9DINO|nr:unnamed protein product [Polarella glacialis]